MEELPFKPSLKFRPSSKVVARQIADEVILVPIQGGVGDLRSIFVLNEWGAAIWNKISGGATVDAVAASIEEEYEVSPEAAKRDIAEFLQSLASEGLVETPPTPEQNS